MTERRRFLFERCLGRGGFGEVYRAQMVTSSGLHRTVAVKTLHTGLHGSKDAIRRLRDEARLLGALHHRGILQVYDLVELQGQMALVTEYLDGQDLDRVLVESGPLPPRVAVELIGDVASALHAAYTTLSPGTDRPMELVHRDIKPSNIRITANGGVKLLDFGIARSPNVNREAKTGTGLVIGTMGYLSPDRLTDESLDPSSDIYGLGCVLFEALLRKRLYKDIKKAELFRLALDQNKHDKFIEESLDAVPEGTPPLLPQLRDLLLQMLSYKPENRPTAQQLEEICDDLAAMLPSPHLRRWARARAWPEITFEEGSLDGLELSVSGMMDTLAPPSGTTAATTLDSRSPDTAATSVSGGASTVADPNTKTGGAVGGTRQKSLSGPMVMVAVAGLVVLLGGAGLTWKTMSAPPPSSGVQKAPIAPAVKTEPVPLVEPAPEPAPKPGPEEEPPPPTPQNEGGSGPKNKGPSPKPTPETKPKPPPPAAAEAPGVVQFNSIPYSTEIVVDGSKSVKAKEPVMLNPGAHKVMLRSADGRTKTYGFQVQTGEKLVVCWDFGSESTCN